MGSTTQTGIVTSAHQTTTLTVLANVPINNSSTGTPANNALRITTSRDNVRVPRDCYGRITNIVPTAVMPITPMEDVLVLKICSTTTGIVTIVLQTTTQTELAPVPSRTCITTNKTTDVSTALQTTTQMAVVNAAMECSMMTGNVKIALKKTMLMALANVRKVFSGWLRDTVGTAARENTN